MVLDWFVISLSISGFLVNVYSARFIRKTFDTTLSIYYALWLDAGFTIFTYASLIVLSFFLYFDVHLGRFGCSVVMFATGLNLFMNPVCTFMISYIRFQMIRHSPGIWKPGPKIIKQIRLAYLLSIVYCIFLVTLNATQDLGLSSIYIVCINDKDTDLTKGAILVFMPFIIMLISSVIMDLLVYFRMPVTTVAPATQGDEEAANQQKAREKVIRDLPLKSSLLNALFVVPFFAITAIIASETKESVAKDRLMTALIPVLAVNLFRLLLIAACTFKQNESNRQRDEDEEREKKRQVEIEEAKLKRAERNALKNQNTEESYLENNDRCEEEIAGTSNEIGPTTEGNLAERQKVNENRNELMDPPDKKNEVSPRLLCLQVQALVEETKV